MLVDSPPAIESETLEFKRDFGAWLKDSDSSARESMQMRILKIIAAFANARGGVIVFGIEETDGADAGTASTAVPIERGSIERVQRSLRDLIRSGLDPAPFLTTLLISDHVNTDLGYLVVVVTPNSRSLTMVTYKDCNQFWMRHGARMDVMRSGEIQWRLNEIQKVFEESEDLAERMAAETASGVAGPSIWLSATPLGRRIDSLRPKIEDVRAWLTKIGQLPTLNAQQQSRIASIASGLVDLIRPTSQGIGIGQRFRSGNPVQLEIRRTGVVRVCVSADNGPLRRIQASVIYDCWAFGLLLVNQIYESTGFSLTTLLDAGFSRFDGVLLSADNFLHGPFSLADPLFRADRVKAEEGWNLLEVLRSFATDLGAAVEIEGPLPGSPWIVPDLPKRPSKTA